MIEHLWVASITALITAALVLSLHNVSARVRFTLLFLATLRFAIPTPWLTRAGEVLAACLPSRVISSQATQSLEGLLHPGSSLLPKVPVASNASLLEPAIQTLWLIGAVAFLALWFRRGLTRVEAVRSPSGDELAALERAAVRLDVPQPSLRIAAPGITPGAVGILRPVVILPSGLADELSAEELESVCAHELAHIRRRDNLSAAMSRVVAAVFWFHPLVWWMERRMRAERELACDEMVVASGSHEAYATALSKVCLTVSGAQSSFAGMAGPNLAERLERIMTNKFLPAGKGLRAIPAALALLAVLVPMGAGFLRAQGTASSAADALAQAAEACYKQKDFAQAETLFRRLMAEYPEDGRGVSGMADVYMAMQRPDEAKRLMLEKAQKNPSSFEYQMAVANLSVRSEEYTQALAEYAKALKLASSQAQTAKVYSNTGETYRRMGRLQDAIESFQRWKSLTGKASQQLALILDGIGETNRAIDEYNALLAEDPNQPIALNNIAYKLAEQEKNLDQALAYAVRAQKLVPESADITDTVGWIYLKKRMPDQAAQAFTGALLASERVDSPTLRQHLAAAFDLKGDWTPARRELRTLLDTASTLAQLERMKSLLTAQ